jgi:hypothetical protein
MISFVHCDSIVMPVGYVIDVLKSGRMATNVHPRSNYMSYRSCWNFFLKVKQKFDLLNWHKQWRIQVTCVCFCLKLLCKVLSPLSR